MKTSNLVSSMLAFAAGLWIAGASHAAPAFDPQHQPYGELPPLSLTGFNVSTSGSQHVFQSWFDGYSLRGDVVAYPLTSSGQADVTNLLWSASDNFKAKQGCGTATDEATATTTWYSDTRLVVTRNQYGFAKEFIWAALGPAFQAAIGDTTNGPLVVDFLRGDRSNEKHNLVVNGDYDPAAPDPSLIEYECGSASGIFRARASILGDIMHGRSIYVAAPPASYTFENYYAYKTANASRPGRLYVGANDGMLHAFDAATGDEVWAYVPSMLIPSLHKLAYDPYFHRYFVDGGLTAGDANLGTASSPNWRTMLVGGLGAGGKGWFGLDVTDATAANATYAALKIKWEITPASTGFSSLGDAYGNPIIVRLNNGTWAAIIGNGYNNTATGRAWLYVIDLKTGALIKGFDTGVGVLANPNGLSSPSSIDVNFDNKADYVYAGDINGNLWKFDISDPDPANWVAPSAPLYSTSGLSIVGAPDIAAHPLTGHIVYFATGRLFSKDDAADATTVHYAYGIWDGAPAANTEILTQTLTEKAYSGLRVRTTAGLPINWNDASDPSTKPLHYGWRTAMPAGERVIGTGFVRDGRFHFLSINPTIINASPPNGENWLNELDYLNGGVGSKIVFDLNGDSALNDSDRAEDGGGNKITGPSGIPVSIFQGGGLTSQPVMAIVDGKLSTTIYNENPFFSPEEVPAEPPEAIIEPGVYGGHFDVDLNDKSQKIAHKHQYDDTYDVTGVNFLAPSYADVNISKVIGDTTTKFKILLSNQYFNPAILFSYGGLAYQGVTEIAPYSQDGLLVSALPSFTRADVGTLKFNMPKDAFQPKDWNGDGVIRSGVIPTQTGCVSGVPGTLGPAPWSLQNNGAMTWQLIKATTPQSAIQKASADGDPKFGYRVTDSDRATYVLAEWTTFWHHPNKLCTGSAGWVPNPPLDPSSVGLTGIPPAGTMDPPWGDLGTLLTSSSYVVDDPEQTDAKYTIRTTVETYSTGYQVIIEEWLSGTAVQKMRVTIVPPSADDTPPPPAGGPGITQILSLSNTKTGYQQTRNSGRVGRVTWHELIMP